MLVYCDTNVYCRPLDDQSQPRIKTETNAFLQILEGVQRGEITLVSSDMLVAEVKRIPNPSKRQLVELYLGHCARRIQANPTTVRIADELVKQCRLKPKDAFHIASACQGHVRFFLTCDDGVTNKNEVVSNTTKQLSFEVQVLNPLKFLRLFGPGNQQEKGNSNAEI